MHAKVRDEPDEDARNGEHETNGEGRGGRHAAPPGHAAAAINATAAAVGRRNAGAALGCSSLQAAQAAGAESPAVAAVAAHTDGVDASPRGTPAEVAVSDRRRSTATSLVGAVGVAETTAATWAAACQGRRSIVAGETEAATTTVVAGEVAGDRRAAGRDSSASAACTTVGAEGTSSTASHYVGRG